MGEKRARVWRLIWGVLKIFPKVATLSFRFPLKLQMPNPSSRNTRTFEGKPQPPDRVECLLPKSGDPHCRGIQNALWLPLRAACIRTFSKPRSSSGVDFPAVNLMGSESAIGAQNGTLANGKTAKTWWFHFDPHPRGGPTKRNTAKKPMDAPSIRIEASIDALPRQGSQGRSSGCRTRSRQGLATWRGSAHVGCD